MSVTPERLKDFLEPTPEAEKKSRPAPVSKAEKERGVGMYDPGRKRLTYIDARYVQDRLDQVAGPGNWQNQFRMDPKGNLTCGIGILVDDGEGSQWVWKWDVGTESDIEAVKGNYSDAFKRAAVHWGIGRDLYDDKAVGFATAIAGTFPETTGSALADAYGGGGTSAAGLRMGVTFDADGGGGSSPAGLLGPGTWRCPIHHDAKVVPGGLSKRTGKRFGAFVACPQRGCEEKPPRGYRPTPAEDAPKEEGWVGMLSADEEFETLGPDSTIY